MEELTRATLKILIHLNLRLMSFLSPRGLLAVRFFRSGSQAEVTVFGDPRFEDFTVAKDSPVQPSWEVGLPEIRRLPKRQFETFVKLEHVP